MADFESGGKVISIKRIEMLNGIKKARKSLFDVIEKFYEVDMDLQLSDAFLKEGVNYYEQTLKYLKLLEGYIRNIEKAGNANGNNT